MSSGGGHAWKDWAHGPPLCGQADCGQIMSSGPSSGSLLLAISILVQSLGLYQSTRTVIRWPWRWPLDTQHRHRHRHRQTHTDTHIHARARLWQQTKHQPAIRTPLLSLQLPTSTVSDRKSLENRRGQTRKQSSSTAWPQGHGDVGALNSIHHRHLKH